MNAFILDRNNACQHEPPISDEQCTFCSANLRGEQIPERSRHHYAPEVTHFSKRIGIEIPGYDGVSIWACPACGTQVSRWTGKVISSDSPSSEHSSTQ